MHPGPGPTRRTAGQRASGKPGPANPAASSRTASPRTPSPRTGSPRTGSPRTASPQGPSPQGPASPAKRTLAPRAPALRRGLAVLHLLASRPGPVPAASIARELGLSRSTAYELLTELAGAGFAVHLPAERRWGLGLSAFEIGSAYLRGQPLERLAGPLLARLATTAAGTAHLGVLHGSQTLYLAKQRPPSGGAALVTDVGVRLPATLTATGLSILAALPAAQVRALFPGADAFVLRTGRGVRTLPQLRARLVVIRRRGWAVEDGEVAPETASIAAPVFDHNGMPIAAIGITVAHRCPAGAPTDQGCGADLAEYATVVRSATAALTSAIGGRPPGEPHPSAAARDRSGTSVTATRTHPGDAPVTATTGDPAIAPAPAVRSARRPHAPPAER